MAAIQQCSVVARKEFQKNKSCFSMDVLSKLRDEWNAQHPDKNSRIPAKLRSSELWKMLDSRMATVCKGGDKEACWVDTLGASVKYSPIVKKRLKPPKPSEWYKKPNAWLSNYDIDAVMRQYEDDPSNYYKFLGVFSIDFATQDKFGRCVVNEVCSLDILKHYKSNKKPVKFVGLITNLDKHDEPGSHWTSLFVCVDPTMPAYGAYYYDSTSSEPPPEMKEFMDKLQVQAQAEYPNVKFRKAYNNKQDQFGNNECGMFSMFYQIRWLNVLKKNPAAQFEDVIKIKINDKQMNGLRDVLYRSKAKKPI